LADLALLDIVVDAFLQQKGLEALRPEIEVAQGELTAFVVQTIHDDPFVHGAGQGFLASYTSRDGKLLFDHLVHRGFSQRAADLIQGMVDSAAMGYFVHS